MKLLLFFREAGGDARPGEARAGLYSCAQSVLHGADQTAAQPVRPSSKKNQQTHVGAFLLGPSTWWLVCFCSASDNIPKADEIRTLVKDIWDTRIAKLRLSADNFISQMEAHAQVGLT